AATVPSSNTTIRSAEPCALRSRGMLRKLQMLPFFPSRPAQDPHQAFGPRVAARPEGPKGGGHSDGAGRGTLRPSRGGGCETIIGKAAIVRALGLAWPPLTLAGNRPPPAVRGIPPKYRRRAAAPTPEVPDRGHRGSRLRREPVGRDDRSKCSVAFRPGLYIGTCIESFRRTAPRGL